MTKAKTIVPLKKRAEFLAVAANGKKWVAPAFIMQVGPRSISRSKTGSEEPAAPSPLCGFGLTASKKMVGMAVQRNRARRRLRALAWEILDAHALPGHNFVLIARSAILTADYNEMRQQIEKALKRFKLWREAA